MRATLLRRFMQLGGTSTAAPQEVMGVAHPCKSAFAGLLVDKLRKPQDSLHFWL